MNFLGLGSQLPGQDPPRRVCKGWKGAESRRLWASPEHTVLAVPSSSQCCRLSRDKLFPVGGPSGPQKERG